ncbi:hypothetical protein Arub01_19200 [Actinomadura rubrobrunea]|uniref:Uncharacterized protein n=1 Tax=Actinomadura rubrobrunea TaxID=115335 RepID=A0A9W6UTI8_9ACTN|nr:hypothetical protein [Actinomadura rubrobrunea]GLW63676.1 hypothetical protein Arub01_19200 [Actinomadura rubrobrunea]
MSVYTPAGRELATSVLAALDAAGFKGLDVAQDPRWPDSVGDGGFRLRGRGDKVEVFYAADAEWPDDAYLRHRIAAMMLGAIAEVLIAWGFPFTVHPASGAGSGIPAAAESGATLLVHARPGQPYTTRS